MVSAFAELDVVQAWGDGTAVAADGMHVEAYIDNLAVGADVGIPGLRPHRCRHTFVICTASDPVRDVSSAA